MAFKPGCYTFQISAERKVQVTSNLVDFIRETSEALIPLHVAYTNAMWEAATTGLEEANQKEKSAQATLMRFWADKDRFDLAESFYKSDVAEDPRTAREIKRIYLAAAKAQQDDATIDRITELEAEIRDHYYNFRAKLNGQSVSDNELDEILRKSNNSEEVRDAYVASKEIGKKVSSQVRDLARVRNAAAQATGFRDHFHRSLTLNEIDEDSLLELFANLDRVTRGPFESYKADLDKALAGKFGIAVDKLDPWHYGDRFFQTVPDPGGLDIDQHYAGVDLVELATRTFDAMGLEVRDIINRSDLFPRDGKNQHAFCLDLDREGDIRTLNNLEPNMKWMTTLLHELGHGVYDKYIDREIPWILRTPPHTLSTEAIAIMMGSLTSNEIWLHEFLGLPEVTVDNLVRHFKERDRAGGLVFTRWVLVMTNFERMMYADPDSDLDDIWWDLVEKYQGLSRPKDRRAPDWAAKYHIPLVPVYYQNYELGMLIHAQLEAKLTQEFGGLVGNEAAGAWLIENVFRSGNLQDWEAHVKSVSGEPLNPDYFVKTLDG